MSEAKRRQSGLVVILALIVGLGMVSTFTVARRSMHMASAMAATTDQTAFAQAAPGSKVQAAVEITAVGAAGSAQGKLLDRERGDLYKRTPAAVKIGYSDATPVVMGKLADLHAGAVVHVKGTIGQDHSVAAEQIVILTQYVQVH